MQRALTSYCQSGGNLLISGSYIGSDMNNSQGDREFTQNLLKYAYGQSITDSYSGNISGLGRTFSIPPPAQRICLSRNCPGMYSSYRWCFPRIHV